MREKKMKRIISIMLAIVLVVSTGNFSVFAAGEQEKSTIDEQQTVKDITPEETAEEEVSKEEKLALQSRGIPKEEIGVISEEEPGDIEVVSIDKRTLFPDRPGDVGTEKITKGFVHTLGAFQPTGLMYYPTQEFTVTVIGDPKEPAPTLVLSQGWYHSAFTEELTWSVKLKNGVNKVKAPPLNITGAVYISNPYTEEQQKTAPTVIIESDELEAYPVYVQSESTRNKRYLDKDGIEHSFDDFEEFTALTKEFKEERIDKYNFAGGNAWALYYPELADFFTDSYMISSTTTGAYGVFVSGKKDGGTSLYSEGQQMYGQTDLNQVLSAYDKALFAMYDYAGLSKDSTDARHSYPKNRLHMRIMNDGLNMRASKNHFFMDAGQGKEFQYSLLMDKEIKGWGLLHEMAHMVENSSLRYLESTNNLYVLDYLVNDKNVPSRLIEEKRYDRLFSQYASKETLEFRRPQYAFDPSLKELTIWDRLIMIDQLNQYFRKNYPTSFTKDYDYFTAVNKAAREKGLGGPQFYDQINRMAYYTAAGIQGVDGNKIAVDIRPILKIKGMDDVFKYFEWYGDLYDIHYPTTYTEEIPEYVHYIDETYQAYTGTGLPYTARGVIKEINSSGGNRLIIGLTEGNQADVLGYEVYRKTSNSETYVGYAKASGGEQTIFTDKTADMDARYTYYVIPVDKKLKPAGRSDGYAFKNANASIQGKIEVTAEYNAMTEELVVKGNEYVARDDYKMVLFVDTVLNDGQEMQGRDYYEGKVYGDSYTRFFDRGFGNWEMHITNFKTDSNSTFHLLPALQKFEWDEDIKGYRRTTILDGDKLEYAYGAISVDNSESALLKSIQVTGLGLDKNSAENGDAEKVLHFDPLIKEYNHKKHSDTNSNVLSDPTGVITLRPVTADANATFTVKTEDITGDQPVTVEEGKGIAQISFDRSTSSRYRITVEVKSNYGETGGKQETYQFDIDCPSENAYLKNISIKTTPDNLKVTDEMQYSNDPISASEILLNKTGDIDSNSTLGQFTPNAFDSKAKIEKYHIGVDSAHEVLTENFTALELSMPGCMLKVIAPDGVTNKKYKFTTMLSEAELSRAELRPGIADVQNGKIVNHIDPVVDSDIYFSINTIPDGSAVANQPAIKPVVLYQTAVTAAQEGKSASGKWLIDSKLEKDTDYELAELGDQQLILSKLDAIKKLAKSSTQEHSLVQYEVTSADGKNKKIYNFYYQPSDDVNISSGSRAEIKQKIDGRDENMLYASNQDPEEAYAPNTTFNSGIYDYVFYTYGNGALTFKAPDIEQGEMQVLADGMPITASGYNEYVMTAGTQEIKYIITAPSGRKYTYLFHRYRSDDATVKELTLASGVLYQEDGTPITFTPDKKDYTLIVDDLETVKFTGLGFDKNARVSIFIDGVLQEDMVVQKQGAKAATRALRAAARQSKVESQTLEVQVTAANGDVNTYTFQIELKNKTLNLTELTSMIHMVQQSYKIDPTDGTTPTEQTKYTTESFEALKTAYTNAKELKAKAEARITRTTAEQEIILQSQVDSETLALQSAIGGLIEAASVITNSNVILSEDTLVLEAKQEAQLTARVEVTTADEKTNYDSDSFTWTSSDPSSVTVDTNGKVTALKKTLTAVTITAKPKSDKYKDAVAATCQVTVTDEPLKQIDLAKEQVTLSRNGTTVLTPSVDTVTQGKALVYTSDRSDIATVGDDGTVTAVKEGFATITVSYKDAPNIKDTCIVTVEPPVYQISITPNEAVTMDVGTDKVLTVEVKEGLVSVSPSITWTSNNTDVAEVDANGKITAKNSGTATVTATTDFAQSPATIAVTVNEREYQVTIGATETNMYVGTTMNLNASAAPVSAAKSTEGTENALILYSSSDPTVASVDAKGVVTAKAPGTVTLTAAYARDNSKTATKTIQVQGITLQETGDIHMLLGEAVVSFGASGAENITYTTEPSGVVSVNETGEITALTAGKASVTAIIGEDSQTAKTRTVHVYDLTTNPVNLEKGNMSNLACATVLPHGTKLIFGTANDNKNVVSVNSDGYVTANGGGTETITVQIEGTKLSKTISATVYGLEMATSRITMGVGETLTRLATPSAAETEVLYTSNAEAIATVNVNGEITGVAPGFATITATATFGDQQVSRNVPVTVVGIDVPDTVYVQKGQQESLIAGETTEYLYSSSNTQIAGIDANGLITGSAVGAVDLTVTVKDTTITKTVKVYVYDLQFDPPANLAVGEEATLTASDGGAHIAGVEFVYSVAADSTSMLAIIGSKITGQQTGLALAKVKAVMQTADGKEIGSKEAQIGVYKLKDYQSGQMVGTTKTLSMESTVEGTYNGTAPAVSYESSNIEVATIDSTGLLTAKTAGTTTIKATLGGAVTSTEVVIYDWQILDNEDIILTIGSTYDWTSEGLPQGSEVSYTVTEGQENIVSIDGTGKITAKAAGSTFVTASFNGEEKSIFVAVIDATFDAGGTGEAPDEIPNLSVGEEASVLTTTLQIPDGMTAPILEYTSTNPEVATVTAVTTRKQTRSAQAVTYQAEITPIAVGTTEITVATVAEAGKAPVVIRTFSVTVGEPSTGNVIESLENGKNTSSTDVKAGITRTDRYKIEVQWGAMSYTYDYGTWDSTNHAWSKNTGMWEASEGADVITVTNHSSLPVNVDVQAEMKTGVSADDAVDTKVTGSFKDLTNNGAALTNSTFDLSAWGQGIADDAAEQDGMRKRIQLSFTGTPDTTANRKGSATITIQEK